MKRRIFLLALLAAACGGPVGEQAPEPTQAPARPSGVLTIGSVSVNPTREYQIVRPFASHLASRLGDVGIGEGRVVVVNSLSKMVSEIESGRVDVFIDSPFPVAFVCDRTDARPVLRRWKRGSNSYYSMIFARVDSEIETVEDLAGRMVAFGEPFSTTGFLLPKAALAAAGLKLVNYVDPAASIPPDTVGYVFSNDAENTMFWVLKGKAAAGAVNEEYYSSLAGVRVTELRVLLKTDEVPRNVVCFRSGLDPTTAEALERVLITMSDDGEGREVLKAFEDTAKFDRFPNGPENDLDRVNKLLPYVVEDFGS
ncbi:MAG: phosphate/phosphite/phosphonate ABC transporter substrate-binding protein [Thermoanaerobaculales bacterium]